MTQLLSLLQAAIIFGTVILFGSLGEILSEKSGSLNLGVPGVMYLGAIAGLAGAFFYESSAANPVGLIALIIALLCCIIASVIAGLIYSLLIHVAHHQDLACDVVLNDARHKAVSFVKIYSHCCELSFII